MRCIGIVARHLPCLLILAGTAIGSCDIVTNWKAKIRRPNSQDVFFDVAIDDAGNVYGVGETYEFGDTGALVAKFGPGGNLHWRIRLYGQTSTRGRLIAVNSTGTFLCAAFKRDSSVTMVCLNPASGAVKWSCPLNAPANNTIELGALAIDGSTTPNRVLFSCAQKSNSTADLLDRVFLENGTSVKAESIPLNVGEGVLDAALRPAGGYYYLVGTESSISQNRVFCFDNACVKNGEISTPAAHRLASTAFGGGVLFGVGVHNQSIALYRILTPSNTLGLSVENPISGVNSLAVARIGAGPAGEIYVGGKENIPLFKDEPFLARYRSNDLVREWRTPRPSTPVYDEFTDLAADKFGNVGVSYMYNNSATTIATQVFDGKTGTRLGETTETGWPGDTLVKAIAVNAGGVFAAAGEALVGGNANALAWTTGQRGLRQVTVPNQTPVGGSNIPASVVMYGSTNAARTINLASNSAFAPVPATLPMPAGNTSAPLNIASLATAADRTVVVTAEFEGVARSVTFYLKAPRPASLAFSPDTVLGGNSSQGTVTITSNAPTGGFNVHLASDGPEAIVPSLTTVAAGANQKTFTANTLSVVTPATRTISASANGVTKTSTLTVIP